MSQDAISRILEERRKLEKPQQQQPGAPSGPQEEAVAGDKFYSILLGEGVYESFLELRFANGVQAAFSYTDLHWFNHDPDAGFIDCQFGEFLITFKGRGLKRLFQGLKNKRVAWVRETDGMLEDHPGNESFIDEIVILPPKGFGGAAEEQI